MVRDDPAGQMMPHSLQELWLRASDGLETAIARLSTRRIELIFALGLLVLLMVVGGLSARSALLALAAVAVAAAAWPFVDRGEERRSQQADGMPAERLWRTVVDAIPEPALALDGGGHLLHANRMAEDQFNPRKTRNTHIASFIRDPELLTAVEEALDTRQINTVELHARVPVERRLLATMAPLDTADSAGPPALLITFRDLTEQDRLTRMRADFIANASHELRTPLASLKGYVETLQGNAKNDPAARERFLKTMAEQAERMSRLVGDLLSLSRVEMREYLRPTDKVELGAILAEVSQTLEPLAKQSNVQLTLDTPQGDAIVPGDRDELVQVFQNLVQNAIKYGRAGGRVDVRLVPEPTGPLRYRVDVADDGPGIAPQHLPRLTERFYRVSTAASRERGGTGLGLAIVKHILNRHRGELKIASTLGKGSTFTVMLPANKQENLAHK
jgi:two-component system phosphate regulon sensor histidine kinase PhoR